MAVLFVFVVDMEAESTPSGSESEQVSQVQSLLPASSSEVVEFCRLSWALGLDLGSEMVCFMASFCPKVMSLEAAPMVLYGLDFSLVVTSLITYC